MEWIVRAIAECQAISRLDLTNRPANSAHLGRVLACLPSDADPSAMALVRFLLEATVALAQSRTEVNDLTVGGHGRQREQAVESLVDSIMSSDPPAPEASGASCPLVTAASHLVAAQPCQPWTVISIAQHLGCHPRTLQRHFGRCASKPMSVLVRELRVSSALRLLCDPSVKIESIPPAVGFRSRSGFHAAIMKATGVSPSAYRRQHHRHAVPDGRRSRAFVRGVGTSRMEWGQCYEL